LCENTHIITEKSQLEASRKFGLEVNTETTQCMVVSRRQNVSQNRNLLTLINRLKMWKS